MIIKITWDFSETEYSDIGHKLAAESLSLPTQIDSEFIDLDESRHTLLYQGSIASGSALADLGTMNDKSTLEGQPTNSLSSEPYYTCYLGGQVGNRIHLYPVEHYCIGLRITREPSLGGIRRRLAMAWPSQEPSQC